jgi:hypothetical protein
MIWYYSGINWFYAIKIFLILTIIPWKNLKDVYPDFSDSTPTTPLRISAIALVGLLLLCTLLYFSKLGIDVHHQGFMLLTAMRLSEGKMLFRDIYFHYGALTAILQSWILNIFGAKLLFINYLTSLFYFSKLRLF